MKLKIRQVEQKDNERLCYVIRTVLEEYGGKRQGTAYYDADTEKMYEAYQKERAVYYIAEVDGIVAGGCGIQQLADAPADVAELQKLYILPKYRGLGLGITLVEKCINFAKNNNFSTIYLETFENMKEAQGLYKKFGFSYIDKRLGGTGHTSCDVLMCMDL